MEVYYNGEWGTVCDHGWDLNDAQVVCNELGLGHAINATHSAFYGQRRGQIWLDNVKCVGTERTIGNCSHRRPGIFNYCYHSENAGVKCVSGNVSLLYIYLCTCVYVCILLPTYVCIYLRMTKYIHFKVHHIAC